MVKEIACRQVLLPDDSVSSVQWIDIPAPPGSGIDANFLLERYFSYIRRSTFSVVRVTVTGNGVVFGLFGPRFPLLSFESPRYQAWDGGEKIELVISGGKLVRRGAEGGSFSLALLRMGDGVRVQAELVGYHPYLLGASPPSLFNRILYRFTQSWIHRLVTVGFLAVVYRELTGEKIRIRVHEVSSKHGRRI